MGAEDCAGLVILSGLDYARGVLNEFADALALGPNVIGACFGYFKGAASSVRIIGMLAIAGGNCPT